jgi:hypothetical protein
MMLKTTILTLTLTIVVATGCTFESQKCPEGFQCTPNGGNVAGAGRGGAVATAGEDGNGDGGTAGSSSGDGGKGDGGKGNASGGKAGASSAGSGNVVPGNPDGTWTNVTSNLAGTPSDCGTISYVAAKPDENLVIIGVVKRGVFASTNSGKSWSQLGSGAGSDEFTAGLMEVQFEPENSKIWWLAGMRYGSPFKTEDNGKTLKKLANFDQNDSISVDFSDPDRKTILVGGHEQVREVQYSDDGGLTWTNIGATLPQDSGHSSYPYAVNESTFLVGTSNNEVYRTTDKGAHWTKVVDGGGGAQPLKHSNGALYWAARETGGLVRSTDDGATWEEVTPGGVVYGMKPIELPDERIAMRGPMGMLVTDDEGANWRQVTPPVPNDYFWYVTAYNVEDKAFYTTRFACDTKEVNEDGLRRYPWDYTED